MNINDALKRAIYHHNENRLAEAEALYRSVLGFETNHPIASVLLAKILLQTGRPNAVEKILKTVISHHAYYMQAYNAMGDFYENKKKKFSYSIKVADFYYVDSAEMMIKRIKNEALIKNLKIFGIASLIKSAAPP